MRKKVAIVACLLLSACSDRTSDTPPPQAEVAFEQEQPPFVGKVWMSTDAAAAPGALRIFLPNGTLLMDSCWETYRLAEWRSVDERRIEWQEDTAAIQAEVAEITDKRLVLRLQLVGETKEETYSAARVPFVCPDMPR
ncbi:MAG: hypothetical protein GEV06_12555 [Luteitalea sp.]|nr:hypothetical protein [Luteitalea sp.]